MLADISAAFAGLSADEQSQVYPIVIARIQGVIARRAVRECPTE